jgi:hypothetical protein
MKKVFKIIIYFFCSVLGLVISVIILLFVYYSILEKKQIKLAKELENRSIITQISETSGSNHLKSPILNLIPVPKKVEFIGGTYSFPANIIFSGTDSLKNETGNYLQMIPGVKIRNSSMGENIHFSFNKTLPVQGYILNIKPGKITIEYSSRQGNENYENRHSFDYKGLQTFIDSKEILLKKAKIGSQDSMVIRDEYLNSVRLIRLGAALQNYIDFRNTLNLQEEKLRLQSMKDMCNQYLTENKRLWMIRNKPGGYERSIALLNNLNQQIDTRLLLLEKSTFARGFNRFVEKIGTAGAVLYLRFTS